MSRSGTLVRQRVRTETYQEAVYFPAKDRAPYGAGGCTELNDD